MAAEPTLEPTLAREEEQEEDDEGGESDAYELDVCAFFFPIKRVAIYSCRPLPR